LTPTPRVEYNLAQLTEMVDRLRKDVEFFKDEVAQLKKKVNVEKLDDDSEIFEEPIFQTPSTGEVDGGFYSGKRDDFYTH
jgi:phage shock protein A